MRKIVIGIATFLLAALYALCSLLPQRQCIACISRQSDSAPIDFRLIKDYCERRDPAWEVIILPKQLRNPTTYLLEAVRQVVLTSRRAAPWCWTPTASSSGFCTTASACLSSKFGTPWAT